MTVFDAPGSVLQRKTVESPAVQAQLKMHGAAHTAVRNSVWGVAAEAAGPVDMGMPE